MGATQSTSHPHVLDTPLGSLKGIEQRNKSGNPVCHRYLKIPYALPPTGQLRWRRPQPLPDAFSFNSSSGSPGDYTNFGPISPQPYYPLDKALVQNPEAALPIENTQSEDCLYLNIWVPAGHAPKEGWPIQFHIHGGWLQIGDACQNNYEDPFDLLASSDPRIIVSPTYRLNLFGFLAGADLASCAEDPAPANFGFWDQRAALEWTSKHISLFRGNPNNITVGGLSAGANSTFFQLYYDSHLPETERLIKRIYLWSNAVAIQPAPSTSATLTAQFNELCTAHSISTTLPPSEKLSRLRLISSTDLIASLSQLKMHTFRASTDNDFIPSDVLTSLQNGAFTTLLSQHNTSVLLGEVRDEYKLYKLVNPPHNRESLLIQLRNYYPAPIVEALLSESNNLYTLPTTTTAADKDAYATVFAKIVADVQVHVSLRNLTNLLLYPPGSVTALPPTSVHRYRISFRPTCMDAYLQPSVEMCHGSDTPIWWLSGFRCGYTESDRAKVLKFLAPFGRFLRGEDVKWGGGMRVLDEEGETREDVEDVDWEIGMRVAGAVWAAQRDGTGKKTSQGGEGVETGTLIGRLSVTDQEK